MSNHENSSLVSTTTCAFLGGVGRSGRFVETTSNGDLIIMLSRPVSFVGYAVTGVWVRSSGLLC